jgi:putative SOS response-associated peptidase YedK
VPASGFFEWKANGAAKQPYKISARGTAPFALAGLWEEAEHEGQSFYTFTIMTTHANRLVAEVHDRMPVIIAPADYQRWLTAPAAIAKKLLVPYTAGMTVVPISSRVNSPKNDDPSVLEPLSADR